MVLNINIQACRKQVIAECRAAARGECQAGNQVVKNVKANCSISLIGTVEASCEYECRDKPPAKPAPQPPVEDNKAQMAPQGGFALLAIGDEIEPVGDPTEDPPIDDPACIADVLYCTHADESDPGTCSSYTEPCPPGTPTTAPPTSPGRSSRPRGCRSPARKRARTSPSSGVARLILAITASAHGMIAGFLHRVEKRRGASTRRPRTTRRTSTSISPQRR